MIALLTPAKSIKDNDGIRATDERIAREAITADTDNNSHNQMGDVVS